jgi:xylose isomerase
MEKYGYRFSFGPWNIHQGADPFGPPVRRERPFQEKLKLYVELGYDAVQFHDDDAVPNLDDLTPTEMRAQAREMKRRLDEHGLAAEFVAPRLWEHPKTIDGAYTSNDPEERAYAMERSFKTVDIANELGTDLIVLWLAREGTYLREAKDAVRCTELIVEAIDCMLEYGPDIRIAIEPKPNEPMDLAYIPTMGHALALAFKTDDPDRVGVNMESAHSILAGLDPSDEMGFALAFDKLWTVHLNDQNGLKFDQDRAFGMVNLRRAFNQVRVLDEHKYYEIGYVGLDVKALRTQRRGVAHKHLRNSMELFLQLVEVSRSLDREAFQELIQQRDYEELDVLIVRHLMGR